MGLRVLAFKVLVISSGSTQGLQKKKKKNDWSDLHSLFQRRGKAKFLVLLDDHIEYRSEEKGCPS